MTGPDSVLICRGENGIAALCHNTVTETWNYKFSLTEQKSIAIRSDAVSMLTIVIRYKTTIRVQIQLKWCVHDARHPLRLTVNVLAMFSNITEIVTYTCTISYGIFTNLYQFRINLLCCIENVTFSWWSLNCFTFFPLIQWLKWGGLRGGGSAPLLPFEPPAIVWAPVIESIKCYFMPM